MADACDLTTTGRTPCDAVWLYNTHHHACLGLFHDTTVHSSQNVERDHASLLWSYYRITSASSINPTSLMLSQGLTRSKLVTSRKLEYGSNTIVFGSVPEAAHFGGVFDGVYVFVYKQSSRKNRRISLSQLSSLSIAPNSKAVDKECHDVPHLHALSVDNVASIFSIGGTWPYNSTFSASVALTILAVSNALIASFTVVGFAIV